MPETLKQRRSDGIVFLKNFKRRILLYIRTIDAITPLHIESREFDTIKTDIHTMLLWVQEQDYVQHNPHIQELLEYLRSTYDTFSLLSLNYTQHYTRPYLQNVRKAQEELTFIEPHLSSLIKALEARKKPERALTIITEESQS